MRKRERENPCGVCGHYHKYEAGEVCGVCGHRMPAATEKSVNQPSAFSTEILQNFLFLGSYDNASRCELLKTQGISHILNTVPACQNLYRYSFTYHCLQDEKKLQFDDAVQFLEQCERQKARVLVHCMSGKSRSPAIVIAYLMKSKGWRLTQSCQWVKERRPQIELSSDVHQQLMEYEQRIFGSNELMPTRLELPPAARPSFGFAFSRSNGTPRAPIFNHNTSSIFERTGSQNLPCNVDFGAANSPQNCVIPPNGNEAPMDSSSCET